MIDVNLLFQKAQLQPRMHMADLGCGKTGHIVFPASKVIGDHGIIYAVDIQKPVLHDMEKRAKDMGLSNVHAVWANLEQIGSSSVPSSSLDVAFLVNTLVQATDRIAILEETNRIMKDKCRVVVVDWAKKGSRIGPPDSQHIDFGMVKKWGRKRGFTLQEEFHCGPYHTGIVLYRA